MSRPIAMSTLKRININLKAINDISRCAENVPKISTVSANVTVYTLSTSHDLDYIAKLQNKHGVGENRVGEQLSDIYQYSLLCYMLYSSTKETLYINCIQVNIFIGNKKLNCNYHTN